MILKRATTPRISWVSCPSNAHYSQLQCDGAVEQQYGLGPLGLPMAINLQRHLSKGQEHDLTYYNRTIATGEPLRELGATPATSLLDLVARCDAIFTMLANDAVLTETITSLYSSLPTAPQQINLQINLDKKIFIDCSTVHPDTTAHASKTLSGLGAVLSAPLVFALGEPAPGIVNVRRYIDGVMGRMVIESSDETRSAALLKIGGWIADMLTAARWIIITLNLMEAVGEAQVFAERTGLETAAMEELITESFGPVAGGCIERKTTLKLPGTETTHKNMRAARDYAGECLDSSSMYGILRMEAGLPFWNEVSRQG
ncbi:uncharacterized protein BDV17DRAFT_299107 [Aspergillus undulatus]|uniref:uncharacterized protein n=1 Tax=Aspergillus undulatus TaxID=1810928 RepID=UPI003CCD69F9